MVRAILFLPLVLFFSSCYNKQNHLGKLPVKNAEGLYFDLYQSAHGDPNFSIDYNIVLNDKVVFRHFLTGTDNGDRRNTNEFYATCYDSLAYLTFQDTNLVHVLYNLRTKEDPMDFMFLQKPDSAAELRLKRFNPKLKFVWRE